MSPSFTTKLSISVRELNILRKYHAVAVFNTLLQLQIHFLNLVTVNETVSMPDFSVLKGIISVT